MSLDDQADTVTIGAHGASFDEFVSSSADHLFNVALLLKGSHAEAEDVLQDALERVSRRWRRIVRNEKPESAVRKILVKETVVPGRRALRWPGTTDMTFESGGAAPVSQAQPPSELGDHSRALANLPPGQRAALVLRYFEDLRDDQVAAIMDCQPGEVKSLVSRALARLGETTWSSTADISTKLAAENNYRKSLSKSDELERRIRAAMSATSERAPARLINAVRQRRRARLGRMLLGYSAAAAIAAATLVALYASHGSAPPGPRASIGFGRLPSSSASPPNAAPGTVLLSCADARWGQLPSNWRDEGLGIGPLTFVNGRTLGYVQGGTSTIPAHSPSQRAEYRQSSMIVEVAYGATVVMKVAPKAQPYLSFLKGFNGSKGYGLPKGNVGFTLASCPRGTRPGPNGRVTDFYLGYRLRVGSAAVVDIWKSVPGQPTEVTFIGPTR